jgi:hypothetical protein
MNLKKQNEVIEALEKVDISQYGYVYIEIINGEISITTTPYDIHDC